MQQRQLEVAAPRSNDHHWPLRMRISTSDSILIVDVQVGALLMNGDDPHYR